MPIERMSAQQARAHLDRLGIGQQAFARLIDVNPSTVRRWLNLADPLDIPAAVGLLLRVLTPATAKKLMREAGEPV